MDIKYFFALIIVFLLGAVAILLRKKNGDTAVVSTPGTTSTKTDQDISPMSPDAIIGGADGPQNPTASSTPSLTDVVSREEVTLIIMELAREHPEISGKTVVGIEGLDDAYLMKLYFDDGTTAVYEDPLKRRPTVVNDPRCKPESLINLAGISTSDNTFYVDEGIVNAQGYPYVAYGPKTMPISKLPKGTTIGGMTPEAWAKKYPNGMQLPPPVSTAVARPRRPTRARATLLMGWQPEAR